MAITDEERIAAEAEMARLRAASATAVAAHYDRRIGRIVVRLSTGLEIAFSPRDTHGLEKARRGDLEEIKISPSGLGIHFPKLDADLYVPTLLQGLLGSEAWKGAATKAHAAAS